MKPKLLIATLAAAAATFACAGSSNPLDPSPGPQPDPLAAEFAAVRRATAGFHDLSVAAAAGYQFGEPCQASAEGAMGIHVPNPALVRDGVIDPEQPEVLLYMPTESGLRLVGVEYMQLVNVRDPATGAVAPWRPTSPWPSTFQVVTETPQLFGQTFQGPMPGHSATMPWHWDLHVWLWAHNPSGTFAQWNPTLQCGG